MDREWRLGAGLDILAFGGHSVYMGTKSMVLDLVFCS